jgi:hypothetical protein
MKTGDARRERVASPGARSAGGSSGRGMAPTTPSAAETEQDARAAQSHRRGLGDGGYVQREVVHHRFSGFSPRKPRGLSPSGGSAFSWASARCAVDITTHF